MHNAVICLMGPTAAGKTDLAIALGEHFPCEIISVDSAQVYRGMDIGTAKPAMEIRQKIPHYLIDICDPADVYSAGQFCQDAVTAIKNIQKSNRLPLLVGGTMLYFRALQQGLSALPTANPALREQISHQAAEKGWPALHAQLAQIDPLTAQRLHPNDAQRIQRALEVYQLTGIPLGQWHQQQQGYLQNFQVINIGLIPENRTTLKQRIAQRFQQMLARGFIQEVDALYRRGDLHAKLPAMRAAGYRQVWQYLAGEIDYDTMVTRAITVTQQLARRQLTWLRTWSKLHVFDNTAPEVITDLVRFVRLRTG